VLSALLVLVGTTVLALEPRAFAFVNALLVVAWLVLARRVGRRYAALTPPAVPAAAA
jgi:hypothetical protein